MYKMLNGLTFPRLVFVRSAERGSIFTLDWSEKEKKVETEHKNWLEKYHTDFFAYLLKNEKPVYIEQFPKSFNSDLKSSLFCLPNSYLDEVRRQTSEAMIEWSSRYPFDTVIREKCLEPAITHVKIAFYLLKDCICDDNGDFLHNNYSRTATYIMLYKFWAGQTGRGCVREHAFLDNLKEDISYYKDNNKELYEYTSLFLSEISKVEEEIEKTFPRVGDK